MKRLLVSLTALAALAATAATPATAQRVRVGLSWRGDGIRISAGYRVAPDPRSFRHCEPEGGYLYCWDERAYLSRGTVVVEVYPTYYGQRQRVYVNGRPVVRPVRPVRRDERVRHLRAAQRAWNRWLVRYEREHRRYVRRGERGRYDSRWQLALSFRF